MARGPDESGLKQRQAWPAGRMHVFGVTYFGTGDDEPIFEDDSETLVIVEVENVIVQLFGRYVILKPYSKITIDFLKNFIVFFFIC